MKRIISQDTASLEEEQKMTRTRRRGSRRGGGSCNNSRDVWVGVAAVIGGGVLELESGTRSEDKVYICRVPGGEEVVPKSNINQTP